MERGKMHDILGCFEVFAGIGYFCRMNHFFLRWLLLTVAVAVACKLTGMHANSFMALVGAALILGVINAALRPLLLLLSLPLIVFSLGFFILVVNALLLELAGALAPGFYVGGFWNALFGSVIISVVNWALSILVRGEDGRIQVISSRGGMKQVRGRVLD